MVTGRLPVTRLGVKWPREKGYTVKKMITAAIGGAILSGVLLGAGAANADAVSPRNTRPAAKRQRMASSLHDGHEATRIQADRDSDGIACEQIPGRTRSTNRPGGR